MFDFTHRFCAVVLEILHHTTSTVNHSAQAQGQSVVAVHQQGFEFKHALQWGQGDVRDAHQEEGQNTEAPIGQPLFFSHGSRPLLARLADVSIGFLCSSTVVGKPTFSDQAVHQPEGKTGVKKKEANRDANDRRGTLSGAGCKGS